MWLESGIILLIENIFATQDNQNSNSRNDVQQDIGLRLVGIQARLSFA